MSHDFWICSVTWTIYLLVGPFFVPTMLNGYSGVSAPCLIFCTLHDVVTGIVAKFLKLMGIFRYQFLSQNLSYIGKFYKHINCQWCPYIENQLISFYMKATLAFNRLIQYNMILIMWHVLRTFNIILLKQSINERPFYKWT